MRITADVALRLGLLDKHSAQAIQSSQRRGSPVLGNAVAALNAEKLAALSLVAQKSEKAPTGDAGAKRDQRISSSGMKPGTAAYSDAKTNPQKIIYDALCELFPGRVEWEVQGLIPDRQFRADIRIDRVVIEMDGFRFHKSKTAFQSDRDRQNLFVAHGFMPLRCYAAQAFKPELREQFLQVVLQAVALADAQRVS